MSVPRSKAAFLRQTRRIVALAELLTERVKGSEGDFDKTLNYLGRINKSGRDLVEYITKEVPAAGFSKHEDGHEEEYREIRHEVRNRLNHVYGPCQLMQRTVAGAPFEPNVIELRLSIQLCLQTIDNYGVASGETIRALEPGGAIIQPRFHENEESNPILVAEDEEENREFLREVLTNMGHTVTCCEDGEEAVKMIESGEFDLVLLDIGLPKLNGFEVLERLDASGHLKRTPVIVVTGRRGVEDAVRCIETGAEDFLSKPVQLELLRARVNSCLERRRLKIREFSPFMPLQIAREFARNPNMRDMPGKNEEVTVLFCDIRGFSRISERLAPDQTIRWLRDVMGKLTECVRDHGGSVVDYTGDEILAMWGAFRETDEHAELACKTAVEMFKLLPGINRKWADEVGGVTEFGIGINSGQAMVGNVGTPERFKFGPLGTTVNLGSRVQGATKHLHTDLLITSETRSRLPNSWSNGRLRRLCKVQVKNIEEPVELFEIAPVHRPEWDVLRKRYEAALGHFERREFPQASALLGQLLLDYPKDGPSLVLISRVIQALQENRVDFSDVWALPSK